MKPYLIFALIMVVVATLVGCVFPNPNGTCTNQTAATIPVASLNGLVCSIEPGTPSKCYEKHIQYSGQCSNITLVVRESKPCDGKEALGSTCSTNVIESCICRIAQGRSE